MSSHHEGAFHDDAPPAAARAKKDRARAVDGDEGTIVGRTVTINRPRDELYGFWRDFGNLAGVMENVEAIEVIDERRSRWRVKGPGGKSVEWESIVTIDEPGRRIGWKSADGADVESSGEVEFVDAAPGRGTMVRATIAYDPPAGKIGEWIAKLLQREPALQARRDLRRFKQLMETGEITSSASPSARKSEDPTEQSL